MISMIQSEKNPWTNSKWVYKPHEFHSFRIPIVEIYNWNRLSSHKLPIIETRVKIIIQFNPYGYLITLEFFNLLATGISSDSNKLKHLKELVWGA